VLSRSPFHDLISTSFDPLTLSQVHRISIRLRPTSLYRTRRPSRKRLGNSACLSSPTTESLVSLLTVHLDRLYPGDHLALSNGYHYHWYSCCRYSQCNIVPHADGDHAIQVRLVRPVCLSLVCRWMGLADGGDDQFVGARIGVRSAHLGVVGDLEG
jgi:hypothetical protein